MKKLIAPLILAAVVIIGVGTAFVLAPQSHPTQVRAASEPITAEYTVTFKTIDGEIIAVVQTVEARIPVDRIPNAPQIMHRPFLRWTNVQGYALDGLIQADISFLPLYSYDPQWEGDGTAPITGGNKGATKQSWLFFNYLLDENTILFGGLIGFGVLVFLLFLFLGLLGRILK